MAWLHSAFGRHQPLTENGRNNCRKGYKIASNDKNIDPDNSDTPLLHDNISNPDKRVFTSGPFGNVSLESESKDLVKTGFSANLFSKSKNDVKSKSQASQSKSEEKVDAQTKTLTEDKNLLNCKEKIPSLYGGYYDEEYDSEEELPLPISGGYRRLKDDLMD